MGRRKVLVATCSLGLVILGIAAYIVVASEQPDRGVINVGPAKADPNSFSVALMPKMQASQYASFDYPAGMTPRAAEAVHAPYVDSFAYTARNIQGWILAVDIANNPSDTLGSNSSYMLRKNNPAQFQESRTEVNGSTVDIMTDVTSNNFSKVAYLTHGGMLATVSLIGNDADGPEPLQTSFDMVLNSWHWLP